MTKAKELYEIKNDETFEAKLQEIENFEKRMKKLQKQKKNESTETPLLEEWDELEKDISEGDLFDLEATILTDYEKELKENGKHDIVPVGKYLNNRTVLLHKCNECGKFYYNKPMNEVSNKDGFYHICDYKAEAKNSNKTKKSNKTIKLTEEQRHKILLQHIEGDTLQTIASKTGISKSTIGKIIRNELKEING